jgi:hypothetical protein
MYGPHAAWRPYVARRMNPMILAFYHFLCQAENAALPT